LVFLITAISLAFFTRWARSKGALDVRQVRIVGCRYSDPVEILRIAAPGIAPDLFGDHGGVSRLLESTPLIRRADIDRIPPDRIVIEVVEREPIALLNVNPVTPIDEDGWLLSIPPETGEFDLPIIDPGETVDVDSAGRVTSEAIGHLLSFLITLRESAGDILKDISVVSIDQVGDIRLTTVNRNRRILLKSESSQRSLMLLREVMKHLDGKGIETCTIDMRYKDQVVVN
jgi:cell division septal protein FtsQ